MKNLSKIFAILIIFPSIFLFSACNNQYKTMAKRLDDSVTNLIYTASTLDWAEPQLLDNLTMEKTNIEENSNINNSIDDSQSNSLTYANNNGLNNINNLYSFNEFDNYNDFQNLTDEQIKAIKLHRLSEYSSGNKNNQRRSFYKKPIRRVNNNFRYNLPEKKSSYAYKTNNNISNLNEAYNNRNNTLYHASYNIETQNTINYFKDTIQNTNDEVKAKINELVTKRSDLLIDINDLYKGKNNLTEENLNTINAYINIIQETTAYLNSNKGIVTNQLTQASDVLNSSSDINLVNAYIIRTNEAIKTRLAKLDSASYALDVIANILSNSNNNTNNYYNIKNLQNTVKNTEISPQNTQNSPNNRILNNNFNNLISPDYAKYENTSQCENCNDCINCEDNSLLNDSIKNNCSNCNDCEICENKPQCADCNNCENCENKLKCEDYNDNENFDDQQQQEISQNYESISQNNADINDENSDDKSINIEIDNLNTNAKIQDAENNNNTKNIDDLYTQSVPNNLSLKNTKENKDNSKDNEVDFKRREIQQELRTQAKTNFN